ncbi:MAG: WcaF family extracellular polysaccharide biosynthesis acetyltransferase [Hyphomicrobium sp.]|nr:WcaF family extracellular polysaccharide biosynthesis acetyltransferase [Hyphomicrobium sp.]
MRRLRVASARGARWIGWLPHPTRGRSDGRLASRSSDGRYIGCTAVRLDRFDNRGFDRGRGRLVEALWIGVAHPLVASSIPGSGWRRALLRMFGARIGTGVVVKPRVRVKFPWRLVVGDHSWLGENIWIDNLAEVTVGAHCCLSQDVYICTGSHDWSRETFDLVTRPVRIEDGAWVAARASVAPGVTIGAGAVVAFGMVVTRDVARHVIVSLEPGLRTRPRSDGSTT